MQDQIQKLLLMGPGGAGKTCMRSIIFDNYLPRDALRLGISISLDQSQVRMFNNLYLNLWDCGGQHRYVAEYLNRQKEYIFRSVSVMLFVFDINSMSRENEDTYGGMSTDWSRPEMLEYFQSAMHYIRQYSPHAKIFVLLHKMDLIAKEFRETIFDSRKAEILSRLEADDAACNIQFFATSIWSDSLYLAYSSVVRSLIPHRDVLMREMKKLLHSCNAMEVALYERSTFLCLTHVSRKDADDKFEGNAASTNTSNCANNDTCYPETNGGALGTPKCEFRTTEVSETVKHFKLSCMNNATSLDGFQITTGDFTALLHPFTNCTYVLLVSTDPSVSVELHKRNLYSAQHAFELFLRSGDPIAEEMRQIL
ncbi:ras-family member, GTP-binding protein [Trypanosoma conorhini]|uniref:Ras-family member, GTP-binding protein n=1 Tax=Trypanosoma conorhini TaxID=83891 RepID=A0A3R7NI06_9TRYP|nr:ras-family member, GTP-binding protein [Trypanosoma conorhini]RNF18803.1 ras-family member, GTP-binding protein [Trypanosoma conorhini]